jgi:hypothetical protein
MLLGNMPHIKESVAGVRLVVKAKNQIFSNFRFELWMTKKDEKSAVLKDLKKYIEQKIITDILSHVQENTTIRFEPRQG